ncbi:MAG: hypothetical protein KDC70_13460 [Saprospiraceae bacterium]|nr:hypothetical protein [Saprospiraceae bacterium]
MSLQRKQIGIFLLIALLTVAVAVIPNIVTDEMKTWCRDNLGPNYPRYLIGFFLIGSVLLVFLTSDFSKTLFPGKRGEAVKKANIPWSVETDQHLTALQTKTERLWKSELQQAFKFENAG